MEIYIFINCLCAHTLLIKSFQFQLNACILVKSPINIVQIAIFGEGEANQGPFFRSEKKHTRE